jgi:hypothetical protein
MNNMRKILIFLIPTLLSYNNNVNAQDSFSILKDRVDFIVDSLIEAKPFVTNFISNDKLGVFYNKILIDPANVKPIVKELFDISKRFLTIASSENDYKIIHHINLLSINLLIKSEEMPSIDNEIDTLIKQVCISDTKNCYKIMNGNASIFRYLKPHHFTPEVINEIRKLLQNPDMSIEEVNMLIIPSNFYDRKISDTTGYFQATQAFQRIKKKLDSVRHEFDKTWRKTDAVWDTLVKPTLDIYNSKEKFVNRISEWINSAKEKNMPLDRWLDSTQYLFYREYIESNIKYHLNKKPGYEIWFDIGLNYLIELAPDLEDLYLTGKMGKLEKMTQLTLARLQYKNYEQRLIDSISHEIQQKHDIYRCAADLVYINTQKSFYAIAPVLLVDDSAEKYKTADPDANTIGWVVYTKLKKSILNLPIIDEDIFKENLIKNNLGFVITNDEWHRWDLWEDMWLESYLPKDFLKNAYTWMIENKEKYELLDKYKWRAMDSWYRLIPDSRQEPKKQK